jgi:carbon-monoxide dehydrogenase small subunit
VLLDGAAARSCLTLAVQAAGAEVKTVEGLSTDGNLGIVQDSFREHHALQCGFCTPGFLIAAEAFLTECAGRLPRDEEIREAMAGNLCRCTGYQNILDAVRAAAEENLRRSA